MEAMKLKMWIGNYDGRRQGLVIAATKKRAREVVVRSQKEFDSYWHEIKLDESLDPEVLYTRPYDAAAGAWQRGKCTL